MTNGALVAEIAGGIGHRPAAVLSKPQVRILRLALLARDKFPPEADDQPAPVFRPAARVVDRLVGIVKDVCDGWLGEFLSHQCRLRLQGAHRHGRHTAVGDAGLAHGAILGEVHAERRRHDADVEFAALGHFQEIHPPRQATRRTTARQHDLAHDLAGLEHRLAVGREKFAERHRALTLRGDEHDAGIERQQHRGAVADGRGRHEVAAERGAVANLAGGEDAQHLRDGGILPAQRLLDIGQRGASTDVPGLRGRGDARQLWHALGGDEQREGLELLVQLDADLGRPGHQLGRRIGFKQREQTRQRGGPEEFLLADPIVECARRRHWQLQAAGEMVVRRRRTLRQGGGRRIADRPVAGAPAKVAAELVADLPRLLAAVAVVGLKHRDDKTGRAITAL